MIEPPRPPSLLDVERGGHFHTEIRGGELVRDAGRWCLQYFGVAGAMLTIRLAELADTQGLLAMEQRAFSMFPRSDVSWEPGFYDASRDMETAFGYLLRVVALRNGGLSGYTLLQVRNWGEVYAYETAARPASPNHATRFTAPILIGVAARIAQSVGAASVTANVRLFDGCAAVPGYDGNRVAAHLERHGLERTAGPGILFEGDTTGPHDLWLSGDPSTILNRVRDRTRGTGSHSRP